LSAEVLSQNEIDAGTKGGRVAIQIDNVIDEGVEEHEQ
jgi:flagellar motor switch protein FliM